MKDDKNDPLLDSLGLSALVPRERRDVVVPEPDRDREVAREALHKALSWAEQAIEEMGGVAYSSQHPRAYETHTLQLTQYVETAKALAELSKDSEGPKSVTNNLVLTGAEALELIKKKLGRDDGGRGNRGEGGEPQP